MLLPEEAARLLQVAVADGDQARALRLELREERTELSDLLSAEDSAEVPQEADDLGAVAPEIADGDGAAFEVEDGGRREGGGEGGGGHGAYGKHRPRRRPVAATIPRRAAQITPNSLPTSVKAATA